MPKPPSQALVDAFSSRYFPPTEVYDRLDAMITAIAASASDERERAQRVQELGAAVRAEGSERARTAAERFAEEVIDWPALAAFPARGYSPVLVCLCGYEWRGDGALLRLDNRLISDLTRLVDRPDAAFGRDLLVYLEYGDEGAGERLRARLAGVAPGSRVASMNNFPPDVTRRLYRLLAAPLASVEEELQWLLRASFTPSGFISEAARDVAGRLGITLHAAGVRCNGGGGITLGDEENQPLIELMIRRDPTFVFTALPEEKRAYWAYVADDLLTWKHDVIIWTEFDAPRVRVRQDGVHLLIEDPGARSHRLKLKVLDSEIKAEREFAKQVKALETKYGASAVPSGQERPQGSPEPAFKEATSWPRRRRIIHLLRAGVDPNTPIEGKSALFWVARRDPECVRILLAAGARAEGLDPSPLTHVLYDLIPEPYQAESVRLLLAAGDRGDAQPWGGRRPLHLAAIRGFTQAIDPLIDAGFDPEERAPATAYEHPGKTPLEIAEAERHYVTAQRLRERGDQRHVRGRAEAR